jgi:hypothetical protein
MSNGLFRLGAAMLVLLAISIPASADTLGIGDATTLDKLISGEDIFVISDKQFDNFNYGPTGQSPLAGEVTVTGEFSDGMAGLRFNAGWNAQYPENLDWTLGYDVKIISGNLLITDIHLAAAISVEDGGYGIIQEQASDGSHIVGLASVNSNGKYEDTVDLEYPLSTVTILKDLNLDASGGSGGATASFSIMDQYISQSAIPEPSALLLLGSGLLGAGITIRRRQR